MQQSVEMKKKIRILRLISRMNVGGPAIQIGGLMKQISESEFEQRLVTGSCTKDEIDYLEVNNLDFSQIKLTDFGRSVRPLSDVRAFMSIRREIKSFSPDIIHTHTLKAGVLGRLASMSVSKSPKRVHTFHGHLLHSYFGKLGTQAVIKIERYLARHTHVLIAVGNQVKLELLAKRIGSESQYRVFNPGLDIGSLSDRQLSKTTFFIPNRKLTVTWIGRAVPIKAPHRIIEIAKVCRSRDLDVQFVLVGDGELLDELKAKASDLPVSFLGWQTDIDQILSFSDLVILTSKNEGTPVALIQAQMAGIPVLTTNVGSASEVLVNNETGFCLEYTAGDFADKIEFFLHNPEARVTFGRSGKEFANEKFSLLRFVRDHVDLYKNLMS